MSAIGDALKPPPGVEVDYYHSESRGYQVVNASVVSISLAIVLVAARLGVKLGLVRSSGWDDYVMVIALLFAIAQVVGNLLLVEEYGVGHHSYNVPLQNYEPMLNWIQIITVLYLVAIMFAKLSILIFYNRVFGIKKSFRWTVYATMAFVVGYCVSNVLAIIFQCVPVAAAWNLMLRLKHGDNCASLTKIYIAIGGFNIPSDLLILILPIPMLWRLQMPWSKKLGLIAIFATGGFVCVTAIIREVIIVRTLEDRDQAWTVCDSMIWLTLEMNIGIFCGCLPALNPLLRHLHSKNLFSSGSALLSFLTFGMIRKSMHGSDSGESKKMPRTLVEEKEKRTYRELIEKGSDAMNNDSGPRSHKTMGKHFTPDKSLPEIPTTTSESYNIFAGASSSSNIGEPDLEWGQIRRTDSIELHESRA